MDIITKFQNIDKENGGIITTSKAAEDDKPDPCKTSLVI